MTPRLDIFSPQSLSQTNRKKTTPRSCLPFEASARAKKKKNVAFEYPFSKMCISRDFPLLFIPLSLSLFINALPIKKRECRYICESTLTDARLRLRRAGLKRARGLNDRMNTVAYTRIYVRARPLNGKNHGARER